MVAKSYQNLTQIGDPYAKSNGRMYVKVLTKSGIEKEVRWYDAVEYKKMYPNEVVDEDPFKNQKNILGFQNGFITIFKGVEDRHEEWFNRSIARYCRFWGWYIVSEDNLPFDLPHDIEPIELKWEAVGEGLSLRPEKEVRTAVDAILYGESRSVFKGAVGERLDLRITVIKSSQTEHFYGRASSKIAHHIFEDADGNHYAWDTGAKFWAEGTVKQLRGTVKEHKIINNVQTTVLTRCIEVSK